MKNIKKTLVNDLYLLDMNGYSFDYDDVELTAQLNLHRHYVNKGFVLIGTQGALKCFIANYDYYHCKKLDENNIISLTEIMHE